MKKQDSLYMQVYGYYKDLIENGKLKSGEKIPSIRRTSAELSMSKTTIEQAYMCLCDDGYLVPKAQSGYYISNRGGAKRDERKTRTMETERRVIYDFASSGAYEDSFDLSLWRRYVKSALRQTERLLNYGEPQGERELREEIALFAKESRNCVCDAENIVIGAGVQSLLHILCPLLKSKKNVFFDDVTYVQGVTVFRDHGFKITKDADAGKILYTSPSRQTKWGTTMSVSKRYKLTEYAKSTGTLIIEDDYGSEFRYLNKPTPSLQGLSGGKNVVYLGTFSKLLLPSIRISYMILPQDLCEKYKKVAAVYNQTVSKADQIALCSFIRDGHLNSQIRKSRKLYLQKGKILSDLLMDNFGEKIRIEKTDSPLFLLCTFKTENGLEEIRKSCDENGIKLILIRGTAGEVETAFSVSAESRDKMESGVKILRKIICNS